MPVLCLSLKAHTMPWHFTSCRCARNQDLDQRGRQDLKAGVYVSTGGNPSYGQIQGLLKAAPQATFHLGFDKDVAGKQFVANFEDIASKQSPVAPGNVPADMREFMESFDKQPRTIKELLSFERWRTTAYYPMNSNSST